MPRVPRRRGFIALDRQNGGGKISAIQEVEQTYAIPVASIVRLEHLVSYLWSTEALKERWTESEPIEISGGV